MVHDQFHDHCHDDDDLRADWRVGDSPSRFDRCPSHHQPGARTGGDSGDDDGDYGGDGDGDCDDDEHDDGDDGDDDRPAILAPAGV